MCKNSYEQISKHTGKIMIFCKLMGNDATLSQLGISQKFCSDKDRYVEIGVTQSGDIKVFAPEKQMLKHAVNVANYYGLDYIVDTSSGFNDPQKAFYCLVRIPEELGDTKITYDVRKPETMKKDKNTQVA